MHHGRVWRLAVKDLLFRRRRFIASVLSTSIAFALALLLSGAEEHLRRESERIVALFQADQFVVAAGTAGPFSTARLVPAATADDLLADAGVTSADPFVQVARGHRSEERQRAGPDAGWCRLAQPGRRTAAKAVR